MGFNCTLIWIQQTSCPYNSCCYGSIASPPHPSQVTCSPSSVVLSGFHQFPGTHLKVCTLGWWREALRECSVLLKNTPTMTGGNWTWILHCKTVFFLLIVACNWHKALKSCRPFIRRPHTFIWQTNATNNYDCFADCLLKSVTLECNWGPKHYKPLRPSCLHVQLYNVPQNYVFRLNLISILPFLGDTSWTIEWGWHVYLGGYHKRSKGHNVGRLVWYVYISNFNQKCDINVISHTCIYCMYHVTMMWYNYCESCWLKMTPYCWQFTVKYDMFSLATIHACIHRSLNIR